ncbi:cation efflux family-domain-containing protein [Lipomyces arxii]|uniref:cation efflux family-domain-containing protein n=1 Tax=Lipomyces arxii TaxID=56418 RepID=UPI0034CF6D95
MTGSTDTLLVAELERQAANILTIDSEPGTSPPLSSPEGEEVSLILPLTSHAQSRTRPMMEAATCLAEHSPGTSSSSEVDSEVDFDDEDDSDEHTKLLCTDIPEASTGRLSKLYRSLSWGGAISRAHLDIAVLPRISSTTANLLSSFITASQTHHHRGKSFDSTYSRRNSFISQNLHGIRAQYLIGSTKSPYNWDSMVTSSAQLKSMSYKKRRFYERQNELIERDTEIDSLLDSEITHSMIHEYSQEQRLSRRKTVPGNINEEGQAFLNADREEYSGIVTLAIMVNLLINVFLLAGKTVIVLLTNSISVIASLVDSALDFLCTTIIWFSTSMVENSNASTRFHYPVGRSRLEPLGVLIFSVIIIVSFCQVAVEALQRLFKGLHEPVQLGLPSFLIMSTAVILKLFAWIWCRSINSSAVQALAQDAMSDIVFNLLSILFPVTGYFLNFWWLDPLGALLLSVYIIQQWVETTFEHIRNLTGVSGDSVDKQVIIYLCMRFAERIRQVTSCNIYHAGDRLHAEIDIVVDDSLTLRDSHDLGEALQYAIETLPVVERAFVHIDYRDDNFAGHIQR